MKHTIFCLLSLAFCAVAADFSITSQGVSAVANSLGGQLVSLKLGDKELLAPFPGGNGSFSEQAISNEGKKLVLEPFGKYDYEAIAHQADSVTLTALGVKAFDWLRITKTFQLDGKRNALKISYKLTNITDQPRKAGLWSKAFPRDMGDPKNLFSFPTAAGVREIPNPGTGGDFFFHDTSHAWAAFRGAGSDCGGVFVLPPDRLTTFFMYNSATETCATVEWFLREYALQPRGSAMLSYELRLCGSVSKELAKPEYAAMTLREGEGAPSLLPLFFDHKDKTLQTFFAKDGVCPRSVKNLTISGFRQYNDSTRGVLIPAGVDLSNLAVFEVANKTIQHDRPVDFKLQPLPDGSRRILVRVPGMNPRGYYYCDFRDGYCYDGKKFKGLDSFTYRVCFDIPGYKESDHPIFANGVNLFCNPTFQRKANGSDWPDGCFWSGAVNTSRKFYSWLDEGPDGSKCMKITRGKDAKLSSFLTFYFRIEPNVKYVASADAKSENLDHRNSGIGVFYYNKAKGETPAIRQHCKWMKNHNNSFDWQNFSTSFYKPPMDEILYGGVSFYTTTPNQILWIDNLKVVPEDFTYENKSPRDIMRAELKETSYPYLDYLETISHDIVTPHVKWLRNPVDAAPDILYLSIVNQGIQHVERRQIVEFAQRMKLTYTYYPLLPNPDAKASADKGKGLEAYTTYQLAQITKAPRLVIVQALDFKRLFDQDFQDILARYQKDGSNILFYNCTNVPEALLGKRIPDPAGIFAAPKFSNVGKVRHERAFKAYQNGGSKVVCMLRNANEWYLDPGNYDCTPLWKAGEMVPAYYSCDFPYWEYIYLSVLKTIRYLSDIEPAAKVLANNQEKGVVTVQALKPAKAVLKARYYDLHRSLQGESSQTIQLQPGTNELALQLPHLPGGEFVADYWLLDDAGREFDCGAILLKKPVTCPITVTFADKERVFRRGLPVSATVAIANAPQDATLDYTVTDTESRVVVKASAPAAASQPLQFTIKPPYTTLYYLRLRVNAGGKPVGADFQEFSMPSEEKDLTQMDCLIWLGRAAMLKPAKDLGFTLWITSLGQDSYRMGRLNALRSVDMEPLGYSIGNYGFGPTSRLYRGDIASAPVRNPCFSDPAYLKGATDYVNERYASQHLRYYGIRHFQLSDEAFLGSSVCYSEHCLADFRKVLEADYGSLQALNAGWGTDFKEWKDVVPCQLKEVQGTPNLSRWLDHKMFMASVFAKNWIGNTANALKALIPGAKAGLSGTQVPGYSYDWVQLMKYIECLSYYGGIQRKAVHDFAKHGFVAGQWAGGYIMPQQVDEFYEKNNIWHDVLLGTNMVSNYMGYSFNGDLKPVQNTLFYADVLQELRRGPARLVLSSTEIMKDVAILYSQSSLFAAMGGIGAPVWHNSQTGWAALVEDLQYGYQYVSYEDLDAGKINGKLLVLPAAIALSDKAVQQLEAYVKNGGVVLADFAPGWFDHHGKNRRNPRLEKLFGINRDKSAISMLNTQAVLEADAAVGVTAFESQLLLGESGLALAAGATALGKTADGTPLCIVNRLGKGKTLLLNNLLTSYQQVGLGGVGGEVQNITSGSNQFCSSMRQLVGGIFRAAGLRCNSHIQNKQTNNALPCLTALRKDGDNYVYAVLLSSGGRKAKGANGHTLFKDFPPVPVTITLPVKGYLYDVRQGKYLGKGDSFNLNLVAGDGQLVSVLKDRVSSLELSLPAQLRQGDTLNVAVKAKGGSSSHVFHLDLVAPDGQLAKPYSQNAHFDKPQGAFLLQIPYNAPTGKWTVRVRDVNTGIVGEQNFTLN